jgi:Arc/MetJ-type ribon-helix-helix transcriptional regulator
MEKTTVYLPDELKAAVRRTAQQRGVSEAEVIRESIRIVDTSALLAYLF